MTDSRKAKVTPENLEEAHRLRLLWDSRPHPSQATFGKQYDIGNQSAVAQFLHGHTPLSLKAAVGFSKGLNCNIADFSPRLAAEAADVARHAPRTDAGVEWWDIPVLDCDPGYRLRLTQDMLRGMGLDGRHALLKRKQDPSMEPTIPEGSFLLVNTADSQPHQNSIYLVREPHNGNMRARRLVNNRGEWCARADNRIFEDRPFPGVGDERLEIVGRVVWMTIKLN